ncbi:MAG: trigger factor, partial [Bdellovibrionaceae bacterium]|nr:trigger factor [Pseudobdellovibrionaceae bacterium]
LIDCPENRPASQGDIVIIDFEGFVEGKPIEGSKGTDHQLEIGSQQFIAGFEDGVIGMEIGQTKTLNLKFPDPYHAKDLAGKPVEFRVTLKGIKKRVLPDLNDEFAKSLGGPSTLDELKQTIKQDIEESDRKKIEDAFKNRLLKRLIEANPVEVPKSLLSEQKSRLIEDFQRRMKEQGLSDQTFEEYVKKWDSDFEKTASEMIQSGFLIDELARQNDLHCKQEDFDKKLEDYAKQTGIELSRIKEFYSRPKQQSRLTYMITEEKVINHLLGRIKIKEVPADEIKD